MEQFQQYWEIVKKQHFWILSGVALLIPLLMVWIASGKLAKVYADQKTKIDGVVSGIEPLTTGDRPNKQWVDHVRSETNAMRSNVLEAWRTLYIKQQALLKWPAELGPDFIEAFSKPESSDDPLALSGLLDRYQLEVKNQLVQLSDKIRAPWAPAVSESRTGRQHVEIVQGADQTGRYVCTWTAEDQQAWLKAYNWQSTPTPLDVRYAQQDLWVMGALFDCIARSNAAATGEFDSIVRGVDRVLIGYEASDKYPLSEGSDRIMHIQKAGDVGIRGAGLAGPASNVYEPKRPVPGSNDYHPEPSATGAPPDPGARLKDGRYVDDKGKPLKADGLAANSEYLLLAYKLNLTVDEQRWPQLLIELANSPFPLDVREVRVDPSHETGSGNHRRESDDSTIHNVPLEIYGFAYIIQPPNPGSLGITGADAVANPAATGATSPAAGATTPASPAAPAAVTTPTGAAVAPAGTPPTTPAAPAVPVTPAPGAPTAAPPTTAPATTGPAAAPTTAPPVAAPAGSPAAPAVAPTTVAPVTR
jgi:hypothetical protein